MGGGILPADRFRIAEKQSLENRTLALANLARGSLVKHFDQLAGAFAVGVAMVPCNCWPEAGGATSKLHAFVAVSFFLSMSAVCLFCA